MLQIEQLYQLFRHHGSVCTDTRALIPGSIFIALKGGNFNGNAFAKQAIESGCAIAIIDEQQYFEDNGKYVLVDNALKAMQAIAREHRRTFNIPVVAITGSNGKTTTKELFNAVLSKSFKVLCTQGNLNNEIGVPLTLLGLEPGHKMAVIEMGARQPGDIKDLVEIIEPTHGLITNIGKAHLEVMGGIEGVIKTKTELYDYLDENGGYTFLRYEDQTLRTKAPDLKRITYGYSDDATVTGKLLREVPSVLFQWKSKEVGYKQQSPEVDSHLMGEYNFQNIMAAIAAGVHFDVPADLISEAISNYIPSDNRSQIKKTQHNTLLLDAYNANPTSMEAAVRNFARIEGPKTVILGEMLEVGEFAEAEHEYIVQTLISLGLNDVYLVGNSFKNVKEGRPWYATVDELREELESREIQGRTILIKGSRLNRLEKLVDVL